MGILVDVIAMIFSEIGNISIVVVALVNGVVFLRTKIALKKANEKFYPKDNRIIGLSKNEPWTKKEIEELGKTRKDLVTLYALYANITAIFPLLGILGTVAALYKYSEETMVENFMIALSTTLLGVFFAIFYKSIDATISGPMDVFIEDADHVIQDHHEEKRHQNEA